MKVVIRENFKVVGEHYDFSNFYMNDYEELCVVYSDTEVYKYKYHTGTTDFCVMPYTVKGC